MKTRTLLIAAVMFIGLSAVAFSQAAVYGVSSTPITTVIATGNAEPVGDITFTQTSGTTVGDGVSTPNGTITIQYGGNNVNITSVLSSISVTCSGAYPAGKCPTVLTGSSIYSPGLLVIQVPFGVTFATGSTYSFTITGVKVQINGAGLTSLAANISATGNQIAAGSTAVTVINSTTGEGIKSGSVASYNTATVPIADLSKNTGYPTYNGVTGVIISPAVNTTVIKVGEGFLGAWSKNVGVRITVSATPPKGVSFSFPATASSYDTSTSANTVINGWQRGTSTSYGPAGAGSISSSSTTSSSLQMYYYVATDVGSTTVETLEIPVTITVDPTSATLPLASTVFTYTVSLAPVQGPYNTSGSSAGKPDGLLAPRFAALEVGPANLMAVQGSSTTLLIPYAFGSKTALQFNTAMAIANTTEDPGTAVMGFTGATPNAGPVTFYLFPNDSATSGPFVYKTVAGSPGTGLDANGNVVSGGTYAVFLNQVTPLAKDASGNVYAGNDFAGYVIIVTGFTNAHGIFVISNFTTLTAQSSLMLVLGNRNNFPEVVTF